MRLVLVSDRSNFKESKRFQNQAGYLVLPDCKIACSGILQYSQIKGQDGQLISDGNLINVYRPPVALKNCYKQFANLPLTLEHPEGQAVTPEIAKGLTVGALGSEPRYEEENGVGYIVCDIIVYDSEAQKKIEDGDYEELSAGYATAFREQRGGKDGNYYEAEQFLLEPNHVALVAAGRCGAECRVCDEKENKPEIKKGETNMKKTKRSKSYRYFLPVGDSEEVVELTEEQANSLVEKDPELEVEEMDEDEVKLEEEKKVKEETTETDEDEDVEIAGVETETEQETTETTETDENEEKEEELIFQVQFEDGTVGKMDKNAYEHCQRFIEMGKRGDKKEAGTSFAQGMILTNRAAEVLGNSFDVEKFAKGDSFDTAAIKSSIVKAVYPNIIVKGMKSDALDALYVSAYQTFKKNRKDYQADLSGLCDIPKTVAAGDHSEDSMAEKAKRAYLDRLHGKSN